MSRFENKDSFAFFFIPTPPLPKVKNALDLKLLNKP